MANQNAEEIKKELREIKNIVNKLGEIIYEEIDSMDNSVKDIGKYTLNVLLECKTEDELKIANNMLIAICGWSIETLLKKIKERDSKGHVWESVWLEGNEEEEE